MAYPTKKWSLRKKIILIFGILIIAFIVFAFCYPMVNFRTSSVNGNSGIASRPQAIDYHRGKLAQLPSYNEKSDAMWQVDLRSYDLSVLDASTRLTDLMYADFDSKTKWPASLPAGFNPQAIMETGKNPGLNLKKLHQQGITGKGVNIAIIDQLLLTEHQEYQDRLKFYEEYHAMDEGGASMHGPAVTSIAVGKSLGVAPGANLYYIAEGHGNFTLSSFITGFGWDFSYLAHSINRILDINQTLPPAEKIRAISISVGWDWNPKLKGLKEMQEAVNRAKSQEVLLVSTSLKSCYGVDLIGLGRDPLSDPDQITSYTPGIFWQRMFYDHPENFTPYTGKTLMVPMDSRCTASPTGASDYVFYRTGGLSWSVPYVAGLYALCCQVKPDITPEQFLQEALATGDVITVEKDGKAYQLGTIVNPEKLLAKLRPTF